MKMRPSYTAILLFLYATCTMNVLNGNVVPENARIYNAVRKMLLKKLDLTEPPSIAKRLPSEAAIKHSIRIWENNTVVEEKAIEKAIITLTAMNTRGANSFTFNFNKDEFLQQSYTIISANLRFAPSEKLSSFSNIKITRSKKRWPIPISQAVDDQSLQVDTLADIQKWITKPSNNGLYTIKVKCGLANSESCINEEVKPFIEVIYQKVGRTRHRKDIACKNGKSGCCRQTVHVTIKELGWSDWFFGPLEFDYHYCMGSCDNKKSSFYSEIVGDLNSVSACCIPTELSGLRALYLSGDMIKDKYLHNIMAVDCACSGT